MPVFQQEVQRSQLKVGVLVLAALAALTALVFLMSGNTGGFGGQDHGPPYFENSAGLKVGAPVNLEASPSAMQRFALCRRES